MLHDDNASFLFCWPPGWWQTRKLIHANLIRTYTDTVGCRRVYRHVYNAGDTNVYTYVYTHAYTYLLPQRHHSYLPFVLFVLFETLADEVLQAVF